MASRYLVPDRRRRVYAALGETGRCRGPAAETHVAGGSAEDRSIPAAGVALPLGDRIAAFDFDVAEMALRSVHV
jgi:hypothetical protein